MKVIINTFMLLLSLTSCSSNVASSSTCPCGNLIKENNTIYTLESIIGVTKEDEFDMFTFYNAKQEGNYLVSNKIDQKYKSIFYDYLNQDYRMTNYKYIDDNYKEHNDVTEWILSFNGEYMIIFHQILFENGDSFLLLRDSDPYISSIISKEVFDEFLIDIGF